MGESTGTIFLGRQNEKIFGWWSGLPPPPTPVGKTLQMDVSVTPFHFAYSVSVVHLTTKFFC